MTPDEQTCLKTNIAQSESCWNHPEIPYCVLEMYEGLTFKIGTPPERQECIPVGCVPPAVVAVSPATHAPLPCTPSPPPPCMPPFPCMPLCYTRPAAMHVPWPCTPPCGQTDTCENITFVDFVCRRW